MAKILTQEEVDALLEAVASEDASAMLIEDEIPEKKPPSGKKFSIYNFRRPDRISKEQLRSLHFMHDRFARNFSSSLSAYLRTIVEVNLLSVEQLSYAEFLLSLPDPTCFNAISMRPLEGNAALEINPSIVFPMIDKLLGGLGNPLEITRRITEIEQSIVEGVIKLALEDLRETWRHVVDAEPRLEAKETSPQLIQIVTPNEVVVLIVFEIKMGEVTGMMSLSIPTAMLEPLQGKFDHEWSASSRREIEPRELLALKNAMLSCQQNCTAELLGTKLSIQELVDLEENDVVLLDFDKEDSIYLSIGGIPKLMGSLAQKDNQRAFVISDKVERNEH
jgi:flagellar motor switch protein FliM